MDMHVKHGGWFEPLSAIDYGITSVRYVRERLGPVAERTHLTTVLNPVFDQLSFAALKPIHVTDKTIVYDVRHSEDLPPMVVRVSIAGPDLTRLADPLKYSDFVDFRSRRVWSPAMLQPHRSYFLKNKNQLICFEVLPKVEVERESLDNPVILPYVLAGTGHHELDYEDKDPEVTRDLGPMIHTDPDQLHFQNATEARRLWDAQFDEPRQQILMARMASNYDERKVKPEDRLVVPNGAGGFMTLQESRVPNPYANRPGHSRKPILLEASV